MFYYPGKKLKKLNDFSMPDHKKQWQFMEEESAKQSW